MLSHFSEAMIDKLTRSSALLVAPQSGWEEIRQDRSSIGSLLTVYALIYAALPFLGRAIGHLLLDWPAFNLLLDALAYPLVSFLVVLMLGVTLGALAPKLHGLDDRAGALQIAFYGSTPLWLSGLFFAIPLPGLHSFISIAGLGWMLWLVYLGAHELLEVDPGLAVVGLGSLAALALVLFVAVNEALLPLLFGRY